MDDLKMAVDEEISDPEEKTEGRRYSSFISFGNAMRSPLKTVHWSQDSSSNRGDEDLDNSNNALNVNIDEKSNFDEISIKIDINQSSPSKSMSPRKKRRASATTQMLEKELKAESNRRNSINMANMVGENSNLTLMAASLRRQNEDLKAKLAESTKIGGSKRKSENLNSIDKLLFEQKENECDDLKKTVSNLEKLLDHERDERNAYEKNTMGLLEEVKKKWHNRDDKRQQMLKKDLEDANVVVQDMELELHKKASDLDSAKCEIESLQTVKQSLKTKLKECKSKLEATVANYESKVDEVKRKEDKISNLEEELTIKENEQKKKKRVSILINDNRAEVEALQSQIDELLEQKQVAESELSDIKLTAKLTANRLDSLQKEYDQHLSRCDAQLVKSNGEKSKLQESNETLENSVSVLEAKLKDKTNQLEKLEKIQLNLEAKIPTKETLEAYSSEKVTDLMAELEKVKEDNRILKVDVRLSERKHKEVEGRLDIYKDMYKEERKKNTKDCDDEKNLKVKIATLEKNLETEQKDKETEVDRHKLTTSKLESLKKDFEVLKEENQSMKDAEFELKQAQKKLTKAEEECQKSFDYKKKSELTKALCLELESQIKEYEIVIERMEKVQQKLKESNEDLKTKADTSGSDLIKAKREINELKSTGAFKETKLKDLEEKNNEIEKFYETEGAQWKTKFEETSKLKKEQTSRIVEMKNSFQSLEKDQNQLNHENEKFRDQNAKLKEEMTTLITSFHSLKDSHQMLQNTVEELGDKLVARDEDISKKERKLSTLQADLDRKNIEHQETVNQVKKLTQQFNIQSTPSKKKDKPHTAFFM